MPLALQPYSYDLISFLLSVIILIAYHFFIRYKTKKNPAYTIQAVNVIARTAWVENIMQKSGHEVLAVQTLRNSTMAATFLASTAVFLIIGVLTLSAQSDKVEGVWHALNVVGAKQADLWLTKLLLILLDLFVAFFSFSKPKVSREQLLHGWQTRQERRCGRRCHH